MYRQSGFKPEYLGGRVQCECFGGESMTRTTDLQLQINRVDFEKQLAEAQDFRKSTDHFRGI